MRISALIKRISQQMFRDKRTLALLFVAPLLILTLMNFLFNGNTVKPKLAVVNIDDQIVSVLRDAKIIVKKYESASAKTVADQNLDGLLKMEDGKFQLTLKNADPSAAKALQMKVTQAIAHAAQAKLMMQSKVPVDLLNQSIDTKYVYGNKDTVYFDVLSPILVGYFVFFFVFLIAGIGLLRERTTGTLERLLSTPIKRYEIVLSYLIGYGMFAIIQTIIVIFYAINVLDLVLVGSIWNVMIINLLLALVALSLGILLSTFAASEFQMIQFIPLAVIPQVFFAGIFPIEGMANWLQQVAKIMPMYYAGDALRNVMYKGYGFGEIGGDLLALATFAVIFVVLNIFALKRYRKL